MLISGLRFGDLVLLLDCGRVLYFHLIEFLGFSVFTTENRSDLHGREPFCFVLRLTVAIHLAGFLVMIMHLWRCITHRHRRNSNSFLAMRAGVGLIRQGACRGYILKKPALMCLIFGGRLHC